jgi:hypothetical protein
MPKKQDVARAVGQKLGLTERGVWFSRGSKVTFDFQKDVGSVVGVPHGGLTKVAHMRELLRGVGVDWNAARHSSENAPQPGGNVRKEAYEDLLDALQGRTF